MHRALQHNWDIETSEDSGDTCMIGNDSIKRGYAVKESEHTLLSNSW